MEEKQTEAKETSSVSEVLDTKMDEILDEFEGKDSPSATSTENESEEGIKEPEADSEDTTSLKSDEEAKKETEIPKEFHKHPAWQRIFRERNEARAKIDEIQKSVPQEAIEKFIKVTSSPEYIRAEMKNAGYTEEAIRSKLREKGFAAETEGIDDLVLITSKLGINPETLDDNTKLLINDIAKITDILFQDRISKVLPQQLTPLANTIEEMSQKSSGEKMAGTIELMVKDEGILDYKVDIEPKLVEFIEANKDKGVTQTQVFDHFKELNHRLTIERLKTGKKKEDRDKQKSGLRQNTEGAVLSGKLPPRTGDFDKDADAFLDAYGIT